MTTEERIEDIASMSPQNRSACLLDLANSNDPHKTQIIVGLAKIFEPVKREQKAKTANLEEFPRFSKEAKDCVRSQGKFTHQGICRRANIRLLKERMGDMSTQSQARAKRTIEHLEALATDAGHCFV